MMIEVGIPADARDRSQKDRRFLWLVACVVAFFIGFAVVELQRVNVVTVAPDAVVVEGRTFRGPFTIFDLATFADGGSQLLWVGDYESKHLLFLIVLDLSFDEQPGHYRSLHAMLQYPHRDFGAPLDGDELAAMRGMIWATVARRDASQPQDSRDEVRDLIFPRRISLQWEGFCRWRDERSWQQR